MDDQKVTLRLIDTLPDVEARNYWNTVGKDKDYFPTEPRPESIPTFNKQGRVVDEPTDEWWINSKEHHYCFWEYVRQKSLADGTMEELLQAEIAELFGCSSTKVHFMLKEAMDRLITDENMKILHDMFELVEDEPEEDSNDFFSASQMQEPDEDEQP